MAYAAPVLLPLAEKLGDKMWGLTERGLGWLSDKVFGESKKPTPMPDYSKFAYEQSRQMMA